MSDNHQKVINRLSLVMTIPEDLAKACRNNGFSPQFTECILRLHNQQVELEKALNELRHTQYEMAKVIEQFTGFASSLQNNIIAMANHLGYGSEEFVSTEDIKGEN